MRKNIMGGKTKRPVGSGAKAATAATFRSRKNRAATGSRLRTKRPTARKLGRAY